MDLPPTLRTVVVARVRDAEVRLRRLRARPEAKAARRRIEQLRMRALAARLGGTDAALDRIVERALHDGKG